MWWKTPNVITWLMTIAEIFVGALMVQNDWHVAGGVLIGLACGAQLSRIVNQYA